MSSIQVALRSGAVFDIPKRTRSLLLVAGLAGVVVIVVECLVSEKPGMIPIDKVLHFSGYLTLALIFTLALRPVLYVPALCCLAGMGLLIEFGQRYTGRDFDLFDEVANIIGISVGACAGLLIRLVYSYLRKELAAMEVRRRLVRFQPGETIMRQGEMVDQFCIIKEGRVQLSRHADGQEVPLGTAGPGDAIGILAVIQGTSQYATVTAEQPTTLYGMGMEQLLDAAGGHEQPVAVLLRSMALKLREAADELLKLNVQFAERYAAAARESPQHRNEQT
jgi:CRP-like cAMP-binding protein